MVQHWAFTASKKTTGTPRQGGGGWELSDSDA